MKNPNKIYFKRGLFYTVNNVITDILQRLKSLLNIINTTERKDYARLFEGHNSL